ncbi:MAG: lysine--tRNA ligase [Parcubacteria group bacterium]|nr:lysine--tRNA ligase [Parcubacteria group bacterium]
MALEDILKVRREKLAKLKELGGNPYPPEAPDALAISEVLLHFGKLEKVKAPAIAAGRLVGLRYHGGEVFGDLQDFSGKIQLLFRKDVLGGSFQMIEYLDTGDFLLVSGRPFETKVGEKTIEVGELRVLAKSLRPIPTEWYGLEDVEERFRKRYLDLLVNETVLQRFLARSKIASALRTFLNERGFYEVETPVLQVLYGGASAKPFRTKLDILKLDLYLRIAPELYLKRLLVGGFEKVYELGRVFRNEGIDRDHNPEFTMLELYWAYQDREGMMDFVEELLAKLVESALLKKGKDTILYQDQEISLARSWPRKKFSDLLRDEVGVGWEVPAAELQKAAEGRGLRFERGLSKGKVADQILKKLVSPRFIQPTFVIDHPVEISPLAKANPDNQEEALRFELYIAGREVADGFSELNDPVEQRARFEAQEKMHHAGDHEAHRLDEDFLESLEYGMPPTAGLGLGLDHLVALFTDAPSLKEAMLFPLMKPK